MSRKCVNNPDMFCYVRGEFAVKVQRHNLTPLVKKAYDLYFGCKVGDQDRLWAPHVCCGTCARNL
jgi:hypothetical protein